MESNYLSFEEVKPLIEISFWLKFTEMKLDLWKLDCPPQDVVGSISLPPQKGVSASLVLNENSLDKFTLEDKGLVKFPVQGKFLHFNTIEEYQAFEWA